MRRRRRCPCCRRLFRPDPRLKSRQHYCSDLKCQSNRQRANEKDWLLRNPNVLDYKRRQTREWWQRHSAYSRKRRQEDQGLTQRNRDQSCLRMRKLRAGKQFDKTKSILTQLTKGKADRCYLGRGARWLHLRLTKPSRFSSLKRLWEDAGVLKSRRLRFQRVLDVSGPLLKAGP
jgi:hypothetical protein